MKVIKEIYAVQIIQVKDSPKIWQLGRSIQKILHYIETYVESTPSINNYPRHDILNYQTENFRIYLNSNDYFLSKLHKLSITTDYWKRIE